jgi:N-acetylmuramoyl-L-alanine amidase
MSLWTVDYVIKNQYSRPGYKLLGVRGIVLHWTATPGATDTNEHDFFDGADGGGGRSASAHFFVDKDSATLILPLNEVGFHANDHACRISKLKGSIKRPDGSTYVGGANVTALGIEMCVEKNGTIHPDTIARTVAITAELCKMYGLGTDDLYRHFDVTGKNCPAPWVSNSALFTGFKNQVAAALKGTPAKPIPTPAKPTPAPTPTPVTGKPALDTNSIVDFLKSIGEDSSFANRSKLAVKYGISGYDGSASENAKLLDKLKAAYSTASKPVAAKPAPAPAPAKPVGDQYTNSLVDYLKSIGEDTSFSNRSKLAVKFGIKNYQGTAVQNVQLLALVREGKKPAPAKPAAPKPTGSAVVPFPGTLKQGSKGNEVERLQRALGIKVDGSFGPDTTSAVKKYQARHDLTVDGIVGQQTWNTIF